MDISTADSVLTEFISNTPAEPDLVKDNLKDNKWKPKDPLIETDLDAIVKDVINKTNKSKLEKPKEVKSNSDPSINLIATNDIKTVINEEPNSLNIKSTKSVCKSIDKITNQNDKSAPTIIQKKLLRGISRATDNIPITQSVRTSFAQEFQITKDNESFNNDLNNLNLELPNHTFTLPDISIHPDDFRQFLEKDLIEKSTLTSLEQNNRLNWWNKDQLNVCQKLWPLSTTGDGNCLLHACSLGIWGFHDRLLTLRKALHYYLVNSSSTSESSFYKRWRYQCTQENKKAGLILDEDEWTRDYQNLLKMASIEPRVHGFKTTKIVELSGGKKEIVEDEFANHVYESLEEIHILALAHVLKRPIIVIADTTLKDVTGQPFAPITFGGIYLPLKCDSKECNKAPLNLTYDAAHFSSLVAMDHESYADKTPLEPAVIPLVDFENNLLPIQFIVDPPDDLKWNKDEYDENVVEKLNISDKEKIDILDKYLDLVYINKNTKEVFTISEFKKMQIEEAKAKEESNKIQISVDEIELVPKEVDNPQPQLKAENEKKKGFYLSTLSSITSRFSSLKRSVSKRFKRNLNNMNANINSLARRSSFRLSRRLSKLYKTESQTKSANNLETNVTSTNSLTNKSLDKLLDRSPSRLSAKISSKSPSKLSNKSPTKSISEKSTQEEKIIPNDFILAANMHISNQPSYREEFIRNYLLTARLRFLNESNEKTNQKSSNNSSALSSKESTSSNSLNSLKDDFVNQCVNTGCTSYGKSSTNYLCEECFLSQKKELEIRSETAVKTES